MLCTFQCSVFIPFIQHNHSILYDRMSGWFALDPQGFAFGLQEFMSTYQLVGIDNANIKFNYVLDPNTIGRPWIETDSKVCVM